MAARTMQNLMHETERADREAARADRERELRLCGAGGGAGGEDEGTDSRGTDVHADMPTLELAPELRESNCPEFGSRLATFRAWFEAVLERDAIPADLRAWVVNCCDAIRRLESTVPPTLI